MSEKNENKNFESTKCESKKCESKKNVSKNVRKNRDIKKVTSVKKVI